MLIAVLRPMPIAVAVRVALLRAVPEALQNSRLGAVLVVVIGLGAMPETMRAVILDAVLDTMVIAVLNAMFAAILIAMLPAVLDAVLFAVLIVQSLIVVLNAMLEQFVTQRLKQRQWSAQCKSAGCAYDVRDAVPHQMFDAVLIEQFHAALNTCYLR